MNGYKSKIILCITEDITEHITLRIFPLWKTEEEQDKYLVICSLEVIADQQRGWKQTQTSSITDRKTSEQTDREKCGKQINFAGDIFIRTSSTELF